MASSNDKETNREVPVEAADLSTTCALPIWLTPESECQKIMFNPWASRKNAYTLHQHNHTAWAENIHANILANALQVPARLDWRGKVVYIVGRGASLERSREILEQPRSNPAIFLNHSLAAVKHQEGDFAQICDSNVMNINGWQDKVKDLSLITFPGIHPSIIYLSWVRVYGFVFWPKAPMNNWMRRAFPYHPQVDDSQMNSVPALHLAALNGAKAAILVGQDYTFSGKSDEERLTYLDHRGIPVETVKPYAVGAMAVSKMAHLCRHHAGMRTINASGGLAGVNLFPKLDAKLPDLFEWFEFKPIEDVYKEFEKNELSNHHQGQE